MSSQPNTADVRALARHLFETRGAKAIAEVAQKAEQCMEGGDTEQATVWRRVEIALRELRGPLQG